MGEVNPEMLVLAREFCGMTQAELAEATGINQSKLSKYENQLIAVDDVDIAKIGAKTGFVSEFFYQTDRVYGLGSSALFNRKRLTISVGIQKQSQGRVNVWRMQIERLMRSVDIDTPSKFVPMDVQEHDGNVEKIAKRVRAGWQLPMGPISNLTAAVENAGGVVVLCDFGTAKVDAAHLWLPEHPPMFFLNRSLPADRYRFTLGHEIGHAIMHRFPVGDIEAEANRFSAELLMPADEIVPHLSNLTLQRAAVLKPHWRVSMAALIRRAMDLQCITDRQYKRLNQRISSLGYRMNEPIPIQPEPQNLLRQVVEYHRQSLGYGDREMAALLYRSDWQTMLDAGASNAPQLRLTEDRKPFRLSEYRREIM